MCAQPHGSFLFCFVLFLVADPEINMETDVQEVVHTTQTYECKLNDVDAKESTEEDVAIKSRRTRYITI